MPTTRRPAADDTEAVKIPGSDRPTVPPIPEAFRPLPADASVEQLIHAFQEMARAYGTMAFGYSHNLPSMLRDIKSISSELVIVGTIARRADGQLVLLEHRVEKLESSFADLSTKGLYQLPPMRPPMDSAMVEDHAQAISTKVAESYEQDLNDKSTPPPNKEKVERLVREGVQIELLKIKAENWERIEAERKAAENDRIELERKAKADAQTLKLQADQQALALSVEKKRMIRNTILGAVTTAIGVIAWLIERFGHSHP